ncbi:MAG: hypothetical protein V4598_13060 [Bdellovibrionota bacterium]
MRSLLLLTLVPFLSFAQTTAGDRDWRLQLTAQGSLTSGEKFESIGVATFTGLENTLSSRGGFDAAYREFKAQNNLTYGVWQEAEAFRNYLRDCNIEAPVDQIAMRLGLSRVFSSQNDNEVRQVFTDLGSQLTFEKKIELASRLGGMLVENYDYERAGGGPHSEGVVTIRDMINGRRSGDPSGVCRDMSQAIAVSLKQMGVDQVYVLAYQTVGAGHATVLVQDPNNPSKTYNINYNYQTSTESGSALSHVQQDSSIPSVGTDMRIYTPEGRQLQNLPTHLGLALNEIAGRRASDVDPMLRNESLVAAARYNVGHGITVGAGAASTPDGDRVIGVTSSLESDSAHFPMRLSVVLYHNERETDRRGDLTSNGVFLEGEQRIVSDPLSIQTGRGVLSTNVEGRVNLNMNMSRSQLSGSSAGPGISGSRDVTTSAAINTRFQSTNGNTTANARLEVTGGLSTPDVRDSKAISFDLRNVAGSVEVSQRLTSNLDGFATGTIIARPEFGTQSRQEVGILRRNQDGSLTSLILGHEGQVTGEAPVFIPGSRERITLDARYETNRYAVAGGIFCRQNNSGLRDCGAQTSATLKFGGSRP